MCSAVPVDILPRILMEGTRTAILGYSRNLMMLWTTPESMTAWILFLLASEW